MDFEDLMEAWRVNNQVNLDFLALCPDETLDFKPGKGKTIRSNFVHIVQSRGARIEEKLKKKDVPKLDWQTATRQEITDALISTAEDMRGVFQKRFDKPDRFKPVTFFAYMIAHEAHHRSQVEIALRLNGAEPPIGPLYELWNWPKK